MPPFCPRCGSRMQRRFIEGRDRDICPACGHILYRNPVPAVGVVAELDGKVVLVQRRYEPRAGCWALPAGYMELGESCEEAAMRECFEESGLLVRVDHLLGVYSYGEGEGSGLVIIYAATATGGALQAGDDAIAVQACPIDALPQPFAFRTHLQALDRWRVQVAPPTLPDPGSNSGVRYARAGDVPAILSLVSQLPDGPHGDEALLTADALLHDRLSDPDRPLLVAELHGTVAGFATLRLWQTLRGWRAQLDELVVSPELDTHSIAADLRAAAQRIASMRGVPDEQGRPDAAQP